MVIINTLFIIYILIFNNLVIPTNIAIVATASENHTISTQIYGRAHPFSLHADPTAILVIKRPKNTDFVPEPY